jgi:hypothetical protein
MRTTVEFFEAYRLPLLLSALAIVLMIGDMPIGAIIAAFTAGVTFRETP